MPASPTPEGTLARRLGFWYSFSLVVGLAIGSGIFRTPASIAARVPDAAAILALWLVGGVVTLCGALSVAELSASLPRTGGWYVYLREGWGRLAAFLFGWAQLVLLRAAAVGSIAIVFGEYLLRSLGVDPVTHPTRARLTAAGAIALVSLVNVRGVTVGAKLVGVSTVAKCTGLALMVGAAFALGGAPMTAEGLASARPLELSSAGLALISVLWAYDGFADVSFAGGEVANPQRNLPRAIVAGTLTITAVYLAANAAYLHVLPVATMAQSPLVAADTMTALVGRWGASFISVVVMLSTFGALMGIVLASPRIFFAMAEDRLFFSRLASVHPRFGTPHVAIALTGVLGILFVLTRTFEQLADTFVLTIWPFYALAVAGLYRLRRARPDLPRPYRVPGYPLTPAVFILAGIALVGNALWTDPVWTGASFGVVVAGVPVYVALFRQPS